MANQMLYATLQLELREARAELAAAIAERARYGDAMTERPVGVEAERNAFAFELSKSLLESQRRLEQKQDAEAERDRAVIERNYANTLKDAAVEQLAIARQERDALRERCIDWLPFTEAAQDIGGSILVWREDAGTFVAFYDGEQECWFTERGEDLTGDLPAYYAKMPQGPTSK